jgi:hypothetical protein
VALQPSSRPSPQLGDFRPGGANSQQALFLPPAVHKQVRELAYNRRVKMHALITEGLDRMFLDAEMKSIAELTEKPKQS